MSSEVPNKLSAWSTFATALIAVVALLLAFHQIGKSNETQREATAQEAYREYLKLAFDHTELAGGFKQLPEIQS